MTPPRLFLLDAYALIFRAYYALIKMPRITSSGFNTSAIFGFVNTLEELLRKEHPTHIAVCFDPPGPTFRNEAFDDYKGEREATPEDIKLSVPIIKKILKAYNIPVLEVEGFEADDVIGTVATKAAAEGVTVYMMTPDKDFGQLVSPSILQYKPAYRGQDIEIRGEEEVCERYGLKRTAQVIDLLALMGDKVDNIPGCPGVGEKTAIKLIGEFGSVENLLSNTDNLKGAIRKKVEENAEEIRFSKFLATIRTDVPIAFDLKSLEIKLPDKDALFALFDSLEFRTLKQRVEKRLGSSEVSNVSPLSDSLFSEADFGEVAHPQEEIKVVVTLDSTKYKLIESEEELDKLAAELVGVDECGIAMLTEGENDMTAQWFATGISTTDGRGWYVPSNLEGGQQMIADLYAREDICKVTFTSKLDAVMVARVRTDNRPEINNYYDISLAHYLLQPEMRHDADMLTSLYLNLELPQLPAPIRKKDSAFEIASQEERVIRACSLADVALKLKPLLSKEIEEEGMRDLLCSVEIPLSKVLADMELVGVRVDVGALDEAARRMEERISGLEKEIYVLAGEEFNISSPGKVGEVLFDKLQIEPRPKKTKTGNYSTREEVMETIVERHPIVRKILEYRQLKKLLTTYLVSLPEDINPHTGHIHTNYNQTVTATGRISSSNPNLQNIPVRDEEGRDIRRAFIADEGCVFLSADYSQIELRLVADFSGDETMLEAFANEDDIHAATAAKIYHKGVGDVTDAERRHAKTANFGILYGISAFGLASRLNIPRREAKELIDLYFESFPKVNKYIHTSIEEAREKGYVSTPMGRKRRLPDINSRNAVVRGYAERNAVNAPIQGFAADIIKKAMVRIRTRFEKDGIKSKMIMQVHDELNFNVVPDELERVKAIVVSEMEAAYNGSVRLTASCGVGENWLEAH